jgi:hypothetical protein
MPYEMQNEAKVESLLKDREWGEEDPNAAPRSVDIDPDKPDVIEPDGEPEPEIGAQDDVDEPEAPQKTVEELQAELEARAKESEGRLKALISERQRGGQVSNELASMREQIAELKLEQEPVEPLPDKQEDPVEYLEAVQEENIAELKDEISSIAAKMEEDRVRRDVQEVAQASQYYEQAFAEDHPDYWDAFEHAKGIYVNDLMAKGYTSQQAEATAFTMAYQVSKNAMMQRQNPAEVIYNEAVRLGWQPPAVAAPTSPGISPKAVEGAKRTSLSQPGMEGAGNTPTQRKGKVSRKWIFENLDKQQRQVIFRDNKLARELDATGECTLPKNLLD